MQNGMDRWPISTSKAKCLDFLCRNLGKKFARTYNRPDPFLPPNKKSDLLLNKGVFQSWWFQPEKYAASSNWIIFPGVKFQKKIDLKPPPRSRVAKTSTPMFWSPFQLGIPNTRCPHHCDAAPAQRWECNAPWNMAAKKSHTIHGTGIFTYILVGF